MNITEVPKEAEYLGKVDITDPKQIELYTSAGLGVFQHVINASAQTFFSKHEEHRHKKVGVIAETDPPDRDPPEAELVIAFYALPKD